MIDRAPLRSLLLAGCALAGISAAPQRAAAQAFDATPTTVFGGVVFDRATPGVETITVTTDQAIIVWQPNSPIFLPAGNVATFQNGPSNFDYAVLNRILSNAPMRFDGTVLSRIQNFAVGTSQTGGTVLFSSPGGIIIGSTAVFDVGNLVLTTLDVQDDGSGTGTFFAPDGTLTFSGGATRPASAVITEPGAQILALNEGSYVAMVAPVVQHGGSVRVNGAAAYVAAEAVEMRVNAGLFDIVVAGGGGSDNANPLTHTGTTGGPASTGAGDTHAIYFVAVPKNQAITAILQGNVGFDAASVVGVENGVIILSAGYSLFGGQPDRFGDFGPVPKPGVDASFHIRGGTISSDLFGYAITDMLASGQATGGLDFQQDVSLFGGARAHLFAGPGETVTVAGNALVSAAHTRSATPDNIGGEALIFAQNGQLEIFGNAIVDATGQGTVDVVLSVAGHGTGGTAGIFASGDADVRVRGATRLLAPGRGGVLDLSPDRGGTGVGGTAFVEARNGGRVQLDGDLNMDASARASRSNGSINPGANGSGGTVRVAALGGGEVLVAGAPTLIANGTGGAVTGGTIFAGGTGRGGTITLAAAGIVTFNGDPILAADGFGAPGPIGGNALGGTVNIGATAVGGVPGASVLTAGTITGTASATGVGTTNNGPGAWHVVANGAGTQVNLANLNLTAAVNGLPATLTASTLEPRGGTINIAGTANLVTPADIFVIGDAGGQVTGGLVDMDAGRDVLITHNARGANATLDVTNLNIDGENVTVAAGAATRASNRTNVAARATFTAGGAMDGREILVTSAGAIVEATGSVGTATTEFVDLRATGTADIAGAVLAGAIVVQGAAVNVAGGANVGGAPTNSTDLIATNGASIGGTVLGTTINVRGASVTVTPSGIVGNAATALSDLRATGTADIAGAVLAGAIVVQGAAVNVAGGANVGGAPTNSVDLIATNGASIGGTVLGTTINVRGASVTVTPSGIVGNAATALSDLRATGTADIAGAVLAGAIVVQGAAVNIAGGANVGGAPTNSVDLIATNGASIGGNVLGTTINVRGASVAVTAAGNVGNAATALSDLRATGTADIAGAVLARAIVVQGAAVNIAGGANVGGAPTNSVDLIATNAASIGGNVLGTTINVRGASVAVTPAGIVGNAATALSDLRATGAASVSGNVLGTAINVQGANVTVAAGGTVGGAGTGQTRLTATGNAAIGGTVVGRDIQVASSDIDLTGALGNAATQVATLQVNPTTQPATLGGGAQGPGYTLTNAEAGRIRADALRINVPALGANPALFVRDLNFTGGGAAAGIGTLAITTQGVARVEGNLLMTGARAADGIALTATQRLEVVTPAGSVRVRDGAGAPGGTLAITSNNIWVASAAIIDRLRLDANYAGRDNELIDSGGVDAPRGYVEANAVTLAIGATLFVQNSTPARGTLASGIEFGGITAGPGGLIVRANAGNQATVTAFGRRLNADGSFTSGYDFFFAVNFQAPGAPGAGFTATSNFNTCIIATGACPARVPPTTVPGRDPLIGPTGGSDSVQLPPAAEADDLVDTSFAAEPLIEEPVTSGGEANLWDPECDRDHDVRCEGIEP